MRASKTLGSKMPLRQGVKVWTKIVTDFSSPVLHLIVFAIFLVIAFQGRSCNACRAQEKKKYTNAFTPTKKA